MHFKITVWGYVCQPRLVRVVNRCHGSSLLFMRKKLKSHKKRIICFWWRALANISRRRILTSLTSMWQRFGSCLMPFSLLATSHLISGKIFLHAIPLSCRQRQKTSGWCCSAIASPLLLLSPGLQPTEALSPGRQCLMENAGTLDVPSCRCS